MTTKNPAAFDISKAEQTTRADLDSALEHRAALLGDLANGNDVQDQLDTVDAEIAQHQRTLRRFSEARDAAARANTAAAKQAHHEQTLAQLADAVIGAEQLATLAQDVLRAVAELGTRLDAVEDARAKVQATLTDAIPDTGNERRLVDTHDAIRAALDAVVLPTSFLMALNEAGIGRRGIRLASELLDVRRVPAHVANPQTPAAATSDALTKVRSLAEQIASWSSRANQSEAA